MLPLVVMTMEASVVMAAAVAVGTTAVGREDVWFTDKRGFW